MKSTCIPQFGYVRLALSGFYFAPAALSSAHVSMSVLAPARPTVQCTLRQRVRGEEVVRSPARRDGGLLSPAALMGRLAATRHDGGAEERRGLTDGEVRVFWCGQRQNRVNRACVAAEITLCVTPALLLLAAPARVTCARSVRRVRCVFGTCSCNGQCVPVYVCTYRVCTVALHRVVRPAPCDAATSAGVKLTAASLGCFPLVLVSVPAPTQTHLQTPRSTDRRRDERQQPKPGRFTALLIVLASSFSLLPSVAAETAFAAGAAGWR